MGWKEQGIAMGGNATAAKARRDQQKFDARRADHEAHVLYLLNALLIEQQETNRLLRAQLAGHQAPHAR